MIKTGKAAAAVALIAASSLGAIQPAAAHSDDGAAVIAGLFGLGIGAAIASDHAHHYHHHRYYAPPPPAYYAPPPPYGGPPPGYYAPPPPYGYYGRCGWQGCW
jgi:hypothetical protein